MKSPASLQEKTKSVLSYVLLVTAYLGLNCALNLTNKWALGIYGFKFPIFLTTAHSAFSFLVLLPVMARTSMHAKHAETLSKQWKGLVAIGVFMAVNIALNNLSLVEISLSLNQVIRSSIPVFTCILAVFIQGDKPSSGEAISLAVLTSGVMVAMWEGTVTGSPRGVLLCCLGMLSNAAMMTLSGRVMSEKVDALRLTFYTAPVSCLVLLPFYVYMEAERFATYALVDLPEKVGLVAVTCCMALSYNVVHALMIHRTSAVATTVLGEVKIVGLLVASAFLLGEGRELTPRMLVGIVLAMVGFCGYSNFKLLASRAVTATAVAQSPVQLTARSGGTPLEASPAQPTGDEAASLLASPNARMRPPRPLRQAEAGGQQLQHAVGGERV